MGWKSHCFCWCENNLFFPNIQMMFHSVEKHRWSSSEVTLPKTAHCAVHHRNCINPNCCRTSNKGSSLGCSSRCCYPLSADWNMPQTGAAFLHKPLISPLWLLPEILISPQHLPSSCSGALVTPLESSLIRPSTGMVQNLTCTPGFTSSNSAPVPRKDAGSSLPGYQGELPKSF